MIVCISGGFDPIHEGHLNLIEHAAEYGDVIVLLNSDDWLKRKKGFIFQSWKTRARLLSSMRLVKAVVGLNDDDETVRDGLITIKPDYFANGGDRTNENTPELKLCMEMGIKPIFGIGGEKIANSSQIAKIGYESYVSDW